MFVNGVCYFRVLKEQWIRAKYERQEFNNPDKQEYLKGRKEGYLWKRGKDDRKFQRRRFILDEKDNQLCYFTKENVSCSHGVKYLSSNSLLCPWDTIIMALIVYSAFFQAKTPKATIRIDSLNAVLVPNKVGNPNAMQLQFEQDSNTRNLFVYAEDGKV